MLPVLIKIIIVPKIVDGMSVVTIVDCLVKKTRCYKTVLTCGTFHMCDNVDVVDTRLPGSLRWTTIFY